MSVEDIKGYRPHTDEKIGKVNAIKDAEVRLGLIFKALEEEYSVQYSRSAKMSEEELDSLLASIDSISQAIRHLKEASMWACRSVFQPEEKY